MRKRHEGSVWKVPCSDLSTIRNSYLVLRLKEVVKVPRASSLVILPLFLLFCRNCPGCLAKGGQRIYWAAFSLVTARNLRAQWKAYFLV